MSAAVAGLCEAGCGMTPANLANVRGSGANTLSTPCADLLLLEDTTMWTEVFTLWGMIIVGIVCASLASIIGVVAKQWRKARVAEVEASLKAEMIKQGRSAEEIEQILKASGQPAAPVGEDA